MSHEYMRHASCRYIYIYVNMNKMCAFLLFRAQQRLKRFLVTTCKLAQRRKQRKIINIQNEFGNGNGIYRIHYVRLEINWTVHRLASAGAKHENRSSRIKEFGKVQILVWVMLLLLGATQWKHAVCVLFLRNRFFTRLLYLHSTNQMCPRTVAGTNATRHVPFIDLNLP